METEKQYPIEIDVHEVRALQQNTDVPENASWRLIDCREPSEYEIAHIHGALLMPMSNWQQEQETLEALQGKRLIIYCHHGGRSLRIADWLRDNGFLTAQSMSGGIDHWSQEIDPTVTRY